MTAQILTFRVYGNPAPQGSKKHVGNGVMVESSKHVKPWRQDVVAAALAAIDDMDDFQPYTGPVAVHVTFWFARPKSHFRTGRNAGELKPGAPVFVATRPDLEKLERSTNDALTTAGVWRDDALAAVSRSSKKYDSLPGASVQLVPLQETA